VEEARRSSIYRSHGALHNLKTVIWTNNALITYRKEYMVLIMYEHDPGRGTLDHREATELPKQHGSHPLLTSRSGIRASSIFTGTFDSAAVGVAHD
jgi:hypothetical protein